VDGVTYNVCRCKKDGTHCRKIAPNIAADTYEDTHVKAGQEYRYKVNAVKSTQQSVPVTVDAMIPPILASSDAPDGRPSKSSAAEKTYWSTTNSLGGSGGHVTADNLLLTLCAEVIDWSTPRTERRVEYHLTMLFPGLHIDMYLHVFGRYDKLHVTIVGGGNACTKSVQVISG
jgi:hypothetical protein